MVKREYDWEGGAKLEDHTKKKHEILQRYFRQYLIVRCQLPQQEKFRLAIVDGFAGAGLYDGGHYGSPLIFVDVLKKTTDEINASRLAKGFRPIQVECLLILNDEDRFAISELQKNIAPHLATCEENGRKLKIEPEFVENQFELIYPKIKGRLISGKCSNVIFNLDQCGYSKVPTPLIKDITSTWKSAEIILTFMIRSFLTYVSSDSKVNRAPIEMGLKEKIDAILREDMVGRSEWLGVVEQLTFNHLKDCAPFVSPFSIHNPDGWRYWLMHFANSYRARQVYNDILHQGGSAQAHYGRAGLKMLSYNPENEGKLYLFDEDSRGFAKEELIEDIPRLIAEYGDSLSVEEFYKAAYSETPAHSDDIEKVIFDSPDLEVLSEGGGTRRNIIKIGDTLRLKNQRSMIFMFPKNDA